MKTKEKIRKLERDIAELWDIIDDERLWDPTVIREIQKRSIAARQSYAKRKLKTAEKLFANL